MKEGASTWASNGFRIEPFGKNRNAIMSAYANELVDGLNILGNLTVIRGEQDSVLYADNGLVIQLKRREEDEATSSSTNPFQIYATTSALKYKVTTGMVIGTGNPISVSNVETEFTISSGVLRYWFYIEMTTTTATIAVSSTTLTWSSSKIPIGFVDTLTGGTSTIYQFLRDHVFNPCL